MSEFLQLILDTIACILSEGPSFFCELLERVFSFALEVFFDFLSDNSDKISVIGSDFISVFDSLSFNSNFLSFEFIYFFIGILAIGFIFKLVWNFVCSLF